MPKPEVSFKAGAVRAAIFRNQIIRGTQAINIGKVVLEVRYKDKDGNWKSASLTGQPYRTWKRTG